MRKAPDSDGLPHSLSVFLFLIIFYLNELTFLQTQKFSFYELLFRTSFTVQLISMCVICIHSEKEDHYINNLKWRTYSV